MIIRSNIATWLFGSASPCGWIVFHLKSNLRIELDFNPLRQLLSVSTLETVLFIFFTSGQCDDRQQTCTAYQQILPRYHQLSRPSGNLHTQIARHRHLRLSRTIDIEAADQVILLHRVPLDTP
ncbi:hypothetical protein OE88DRAFT_415542 [Heliocybe sulcata]|uniref:Uncharacterized protein n=1 Tax=Heliocybe sulcata TaxID=5364 RepID=A0A5C3MW33_9AGAM|nr:hypothetical protein OE88DRAFT_415542 [Heliocybe sulcata]